jgi:hypothetical protein
LRDSLVCLFEQFETDELDDRVAPSGEMNIDSCRFEVTESIEDATGKQFDMQRTGRIVRLEDRLGKSTPQLFALFEARQ